MTRFVSERYPELRLHRLKVRFRKGVAEVENPQVARKLAKSRTKGVRLADGEQLPEPDQEAEDPQRPAVRAPREDWAAYAVAQGADEGEVFELTKQQLIERYGG